MKTSAMVSPCLSDHDATFRGWLELLSGETVALYNITAANHPLLGSAVTFQGLRKLRLVVPHTPPFQGRGQELRALRAAHRRPFPS